MLTGVQLCVGCPDNQYFAVETEQCISGCPQGTLYNKDNKTCDSGRYLTNPDASNLLSPAGTFETWKQNINKIKSQTSYSQYCPSDKPF